MLICVLLRLLGLGLLLLLLLLLLELRQLAGWLHYGAEERTATQPIIARDQEERANRSGLQKKIQLGRNRDEAAGGGPATDICCPSARTY